MKVQVVIDVEMCRVSSKTGSFPCKNEIIQIGAVMMNESYEIIDRFSTYVTPRYGKINHYIAALTGISERTIKGAPDIEEALLQMLRWIGKRIDSPRRLKLADALDLAEVDTEGHLHDGLDDACNTARMIANWSCRRITRQSSRKSVPWKRTRGR